ncbi:hypothetical protein NX059_011768 [Plenodomus lindquistii]|nr:hypothetical protein NX059_011768 [Plenodomus lindquistii]
MTTSIPAAPLPSEFDDEVDDAHPDLPPGHVWAYPCKLSSCPDYGKSWRLRSNFLLHLQEEGRHKTATTPAERRIIEQEWRYTTDPRLPPRTGPNFRPQDDPDKHIWNYGFKDNTGKVINGRGTMRQMEMHMALRRQEMQERQTE